MMTAMVDNGVFRGYQVGQTELVQISQLQFDKDTLIIEEKSWDNVRAMCVALILFEVISRT